MNGYTWWPNQGCKTAPEWNEKDKNRNTVGQSTESHEQLKQTDANVALEHIIFLKRVINILSIVYSEDLSPKDRILLFKAWALCL